MLKIEGLGEPEAEEELQQGREAEEQGGKAEGQECGAEESFTITQFTPGLRDPNRVNVFVNHHFAFSLDMSQVVNLQVKVGQKLSAERLKDLQRASEFGKLYQRALEWVLTRPHSLRETRDYLRRRQIQRNQTNKRRVREELKPLPELQNEAIDLVIDRLLEKGYIDDRKFAEYFVENRFVKKGVSKKRLQIELRKKGVSEDIIDAVLQDAPRDEQAEMQKMIAKKYRKYDKQKLLQYLVRQGFDYQDAMQAINEFHEGYNG